jgi:MoaA/NifB/PqqE/SkfB family radical SAM enzyme
MLKALWKKIFPGSSAKKFSAWQVELTSRCPLQCKMCSRTAYKDFFSKDMNPDDFRKLLPYLPEVEAVVLEGWGESLLHKRLLDCIGWVKEKGPRAGFVTSGMGLNESLIFELLKVGVDFMGFSLSGATPQTHNAIRVNSDLEDLQKNILTLQEMKARQNLVNPQLHIVYLLLKENIREVPALIRLARDLGIHEVILIHLIQVSNSWQEEQRVFRENGSQQFGNILKEARAKAKEWRIELQCPSLSLGEVPICAEMPLRNLYISVDGEVSPCVYLNPPVPTPFKRIFQGKEFPIEKVSFGNIFQKSFQEIWQNLQYEEFRACFTCRQEKMQEMIGTLWDPEKRKNLESFSLPPPPLPCRTCYKIEGF